MSSQYLRSWGVACTGAAKCAGMMRLKSHLPTMSSIHRRDCTIPPVLSDSYL